MTIIKPVCETETKIEVPLTDEEKEVLDVLSVDITGELDDALKKIRKLIAKGKTYLESFYRILLQKILDYNFIGNYNYAFLLYELNDERVSEFIVTNIISNLMTSIKSYEYQKSMISARFIGELFKYEMVKRNQLYKILEDLLIIEANQVGVINAVCTVL